MPSATDPLQVIAETIGVSANTVLRVLRGENKEVWPSAARRANEIRRLAREIGYLPHGSARAMRRGRLDCLALLLSADRGRSHLPEDLLNGVADSCDRQHQRLLVAKVSDERLSDDGQLPRILAEWSCDGVLINYTDRIPPAMPELVARCRIPAVWINSRHEADAVWYDDRGGSAAATRRLLALGHRRIAWLDFVAPGPGIHYSREERPLGVSETLAAAGVTGLDLRRMREVPLAERLGATVELLRRPDRPTALIAYDNGDRLLLAAALAGLRVPQDLSLVVFGPGSGTAAERAAQHNHIGLRLSTIVVPGAAAGAAAVAMLLRKIAEPGAPQPAEILTMAFEDGDTCGPAPAG